MKEGESRRGGIYWETVIDTEYSGDWGVDMMRRECVRKIRCFLACVPLGGCVCIHHPSCVHPGADRVQSTERFLLHRRPAPRYSFLNSKHLGQFAWKRASCEIRGIDVQARYPLGLFFCCCCSRDKSREPIQTCERKPGPQVLPPSSVRPMWTILKVLYLVKAVSTDGKKSELFNRRDFVLLLFLFLFSLFLFVVLFTEKSMAVVCVCGWCCSQSAHIPEAPHPKPSGLLVE